MTTLLHVSDLHFGRHSVPAQVAAIERLLAAERFDVVVVSGDLTQRARPAEYRRARAFLDHVEARSRALAVPGNHDVCWWFAPLHVGCRAAMYAPWRRRLGRPVEPVLTTDDATIVGLNTAHGISPHTLTTRLRDLSVLGDLRPAQLDRAERAFAARGDGPYRVVVMHHNPVAGELSGRHGLKHHEAVLRRLAAMGVDLVLCGHDHQEAVHQVTTTPRGIVVATAGTLTTRSRGGRPAAVNVVHLAPRELRIETRAWESGTGAFARVTERGFGRLTAPPSAPAR